MLYAVTIEPLNGIYLVLDRPDECPWEVQEGVELHLTPLFGTWTPDLGPLRQVLCVSDSDPKCYRVLTNPRDRDLASLGLRPTGRRFGGLFPKAVWERFAQTAPSALAILAIGDDQPAEAAEEVVTAMK
jgi:hypothetical protein